MKIHAISLIVLTLLLSGCGQPQQEEKPVHVSAGQGIFLNNCVTCHQGDGYPPGPNTAIINSSYLKSEKSFSELLNSPTSPGMPPFPPERLPEADRHELYVYLKTVIDKGSDS